MQLTGGMTHWHGDHPKGLGNPAGMERFVRHFKPLADDLANAGVEVVNCTRETALTCFPRATIAEALNA